jgi:hypothetical protein
VPPLVIARVEEQKTEEEGGERWADFICAEGLALSWPQTVIHQYAFEEVFGIPIAVMTLQRVPYYFNVAADAS